MEHRPVQRDVVEGVHYQTGQAVRIGLEHGLIASVSPIDLDGGAHPLLWIGPGLVDLQVNGFAGHDLNAAGLQAEVVLRLTESLWAQGVTGYMPTLISTDPRHLLTAITSIMQAMQEDVRVRRSILGIHLEGPFLSRQDGPRGAHDAAWIQAPDWRLFEVWQTAARGAIRLVTLSPEWDTAPAFIARCTASGVRVAIGHTAATSAQIEAAIRAGATLSTHLGNGAHATLPRHPNYLWDQLASDALWASVIGDGFHLPWAVLKVILRVKHKQVFLVSDSVALAGLAPGTYHTSVGGAVVLSPEGRLHLAAAPNLLAGSAQPLLKAVGRLAETELCTFAGAWDLASMRPAAYLGLGSAAGLAVGAPADLVLFERTPSGPRVVSTWLRGHRVFDAHDQTTRTSGGANQ